METNDTSGVRLVDAVRQSQMLRLVSLGILTIVLLVPVLMIAALVDERQQRRDDAIAEVVAKWGSAQTVTGPALVLPYIARWVETDAKDKTITREARRDLVVLPSKLRVRGTIDTTVLSRGIFLVPVYKETLTLVGEFDQLRPGDLDIKSADVMWDHASLAIGISEVRTIQDQVTVAWNGTPVAFLPDTGGFGDVVAGIHAPVPVNETTRTFAFSVPLTINGSVGAYFVPSAADTAVEISSNFLHPNFQGNWLPTDRTITNQGFRAAWAMPSLGRNYPQMWTTPATGMKDAIEKSRFGVELSNPVDPYRMADRSVKYAALFILLTFTSIWLVEVLSGVRVHPIQYLMIGAALCIFYLLELSLSEHITFPAAYATATLAIVAMVAAYSRAVLLGRRRALVVGAGVAALYGYLYVLLTNEDFALLIGSIGLFVVLGGIMILTRRVNWYSSGAPATPRA
jgi:inner membrane protein